MVLTSWALLWEHVSQADGGLLWWMYTHWGPLGVWKEHGEKPVSFPLLHTYLEVVGSKPVIGKMFSA